MCFEYILRKGVKNKRLHNVFVYYAIPSIRIHSISKSTKHFLVLLFCNTGFACFLFAAYNIMTSAGRGH